MLLRLSILFAGAAFMLGACDQQSDHRNEGVTVELPPPLPPAGFENAEVENAAEPVELNIARPMIDEREPPAETETSSNTQEEPPAPASEPAGNGSATHEQ